MLELPNDMVNEVLGQLDACASQWEFPVLDNVHWGLADTKLSVFRSETEWLIVFELIVFHRPAVEFQNVIYGFGNKLQSPGFQTAIKIIDISDDYPFEDDEGNPIVDIHEFVVKIDGQLETIRPSPEELIASGVEQAPNPDPETQVLRLLCHLMPDRFFLASSRLLELLGQPKDLSLFLELRSWFHPDIAAGKRPSQNPCFQNLAKALSYNDPAIYKCPENLHNTHWSHWG